MCGTVPVTVGSVTDLPSISSSFFFFKYCYQVCASLFVLGSCQHCQIQSGRRVSFWWCVSLQCIFMMEWCSICQKGGSVADFNWYCGCRSRKDRDKTFKHGERKRDRERERQTYRQRDRQTKRQTEREREKERVCVYINVNHTYLFSCLKGFPRKCLFGPNKDNQWRHLCTWEEKVIKSEHISRICGETMCCDIFPPLLPLRPG